MKGGERVRLEAGGVCDDRGCKFMTAFSMFFSVLAPPTLHTWLMLLVLGGWQPYARLAAPLSIQTLFLLRNWPRYLTILWSGTNLPGVTCSRYHLKGLHCSRSRNCRRSLTSPMSTCVIGGDAVRLL